MQWDEPILFVPYPSHPFILGISGQGGDSQFLVVAQMNIRCLEEMLRDCVSWGLPTHYSVKALASTADLNYPNDEDKPGCLVWDWRTSQLRSSAQSWSKVSKTTA